MPHDGPIVFCCIRGRRRETESEHASPFFFCISFLSSFISNDTQLIEGELGAFYCSSPLRFIILESLITFSHISTSFQITRDGILPVIIQFKQRHLLNELRFHHFRSDEGASLTLFATLHDAVHTAEICVETPIPDKTAPRACHPPRCPSHTSSPPPPFPTAPRLPPRRPPPLLRRRATRRQRSRDSSGN